MFYTRVERDQLEKEHIEFHQDWRAEEFILIPQELLLSDKLTDGEKMFFFKLVALSNKSKGTLLHGNDTLSEEFECSTSNIKKFLDSLKKKKVIKTLSTGPHKKRIICLTPWDFITNNERIS